MCFEYAEENTEQGALDESPVDPVRPWGGSSQDKDAVSHPLCERTASSFGGWSGAIETLPLIERGDLIPSNESGRFSSCLRW